MRANTYLYTLRKKLGLTIEEFATLIGSNSGVLSMAEIGKRNLPFNSSMLATHWELSMMEAEKIEAEKNNAEDWKDPAAIQAFCHQKIRVASIKLEKLSLALESLISKAHTLGLLLQTIQVHTSKSSSIQSEIIPLQIEVLERKAREKLKDIHIQIIEHNISIAGLKAEIEAATQTI
jgi:transcriptional regulator with XRE-family HTH domain